MFAEKDTVTIVSAGAVTDDGTGDGPDIVAERLVVDAVHAIGEEWASIETAVAMALLSTEEVAAGISIENTGELMLEGASSAGGGNIWIEVASPLEIVGDVHTTDNGGIDLIATEDGNDDDSITISDRVTIISDQGDIRIEAGQDVLQGEMSLIQTGGSAFIYISADQDATRSGGVFDQTYFGRR